MKQERITHTLAVAVAVALVCSAMVSAAVYILRPIQQAYLQTDRNRTILDAAGFDVAAADEPDVMRSFRSIDARVVDLATGTLTAAPVADAHTYDHWIISNESSPALLRQQPSAGELPGIARYVPVYVVWRGQQLERLVLPVHGVGMWSTIHAYVALADDFVTVEAFTVYRHGETPGIGDRIEDADWLRRWSGKRAYDASGQVLIDVVREPQQPAVQIDHITGATVTSNAVGRLVRSWLGPQGYGPFLAALRRGDIVLQSIEGAVNESP